MASDVATGKLMLSRYLTPKELALGGSRIVGIPSNLKLERLSRSELWRILQRIGVGRAVVGRI
jgi:hypothetical protein